MYKLLVRIGASKKHGVAIMHMNTTMHLLRDIWLDHGVVYLVHCLSMLLLVVLYVLLYRQFAHCDTVALSARCV
jgi:hypothetical protein